MFDSLLNILWHKLERKIASKPTNRHFVIIERELKRLIIKYLYATTSPLITTNSEEKDKASIQ